jgi:hypothetical protein
MSGLDLDHALLYQARKFITAANVHYVKTCIFCYEISAPHSQHRQQYERLLREFVGSENRLLAARTLAELVRYRSKNCASAAGESTGCGQICVL